MQILAGLLCVCALGGTAYCCLIASNYGPGEPLRRVGRWLLATADAVDLSVETCQQEHRETAKNALIEFPPGRTPVGKQVTL